uniref:Uncharacterized protein n=1 Tax=Plectus sambesii TaxID=2011161 RepID=A0A914WVM3_9BILA
MYKPWLTIFIVSTFAASVLAQPTYGPCGDFTRTRDIHGAIETAATPSISCSPVRGVADGTCDEVARQGTGLNAVCTYNYFTAPASWVCCFDISKTMYGGFSTPGPGLTFGTLGPLSTPFPQFLKPECPNGALSSISSMNNQPRTCNITASANRKCPADYTCVKARNVVDVFGTASLADDLGAGWAPYICCKTTTLNNYGAVFTESGLSPGIVPLTPAAGILSVKLAVSTVQLGDDVSYIWGQFTSTPREITLYSPTVAASFYHVMMFDATYQKEVWFYINKPGSGKPTLSVRPWRFPEYAQVVNTGTLAAPVYNITSVELASKAYTTVARRMVILIWKTASKLVPTAAKILSTTQLNLSPGLYGDFEPSRAAATKGVYINVTTLLASTNKITKILGRPIAGTYFMAKI